MGSDRSISGEDKAALAKARDLGIQVSLSTGRAAQGTLAIIKQLSLDGYHVFFDGALVSDTAQNKEVYVQPVGKEVLRRAIEFAHLNDIPLELYSATHYFVERETWSTEAHSQLLGLSPTVIDFNGLWEQERIIKGGLVASSPEEAARANSFCLELDGELYFSWASTPAYPGVDFINIVAPGVSKGRALEALASHLGIPLAQVMAIGDEVNDISALSIAGLAVAMDNAPAEVKAVADYITLDVDHNGAAAAIEKFLL